jgi:hypothetical protein
MGSMHVSRLASSLIQVYHLILFGTTLRAQPEIALIPPELQFLERSSDRNDLLDATKTAFVVVTCNVFLTSLCRSCRQTPGTAIMSRFGLATT